MKIRYPIEVVDFLKANGNTISDGYNTFYQFPTNWLMETDIDNVLEDELEDSQLKTIEKHFSDRCVINP